MVWGWCRRDDGSWDVRLIDFDWSVAEGRVCYPGYLNGEISWAAGVAAHQPILQAHGKDVQLLDNTLAEERPNIRANSGTGSASTCAADPSNADAQSSSVSGSREAETPIARPAKPLERNIRPAGKKGKERGPNSQAAMASDAAIQRTALPALPRRPPPQLRQHSTPGACKRILRWRLASSRSDVLDAVCA